MSDAAAWSKSELEIHKNFQRSAQRRRTVCKRTRPRNVAGNEVGRMGFSPVR